MAEYGGYYHILDKYEHPERPAIRVWKQGCTRFDPQFLDAFHWFEYGIVIMRQWVKSLKVPRNGGDWSLKLTRLRPGYRMLVFLGDLNILNHPSCHALLPRVCYPVQQPVCWNRRIGWWNDFLISSHIPLNQCVCRIFPGSPGVRWTQTNLTKQILFCQAIPRWNEEFTVSIKKLKMVQCLSISFNDYISVYSWRLGSYQFLHGHNKHRWKTLGGPWWVSLSENMWPKNLMVHHGLSSYSLWIGGLANPGGLLFIRIFFQYMFSFDQTVQLPWPCAVSNPCHSLSGAAWGRICSRPSKPTSRHMCVWFIQMLCGKI